MVAVSYVYVCLHCAARSPEEHARCLQCGEYGTLVSRNDDADDDLGSPSVRSMARLTLRPSAAAAIVGTAAMDPISIPTVAPTPARALRLVEIPRSASGTCTSTGLAEVDRVLGGGIFDGAPILLSAPGGSGKSTMALSIANRIASGPDRDVVYATGEETIEDIALRADRLGATAARLRIVAETSLERILDLAGRALPSLLVVDSIQVIRSDAASSDAGSAHQIRLCVAALARFAKQTKVPILIIGHVNKEGEMAGPETLRHLVDVVLYLEAADGGNGQRRYLSTSKNRHGATSEIGVLEMTGRGLVDAPNDDSADLRARTTPVPGSILCPVVFGERVTLVEIEALVGPVREGKSSGEVNATGVDRARVQRILAILARHAAIDVTDRNVYVSVAGGLRVTDPAADLAIALAIESSARDAAYAPGLRVCGELALSGEVRLPVPRWEARLAEIERHGLGSGMTAYRALSIAIEAEHGLSFAIAEVDRTGKGYPPANTESDLELLIEEHMEDAEALLRDAERGHEIAPSIPKPEPTIERVMSAMAERIRKGTAITDDIKIYEAAAAAESATKS